MTDQDRVELMQRKIDLGLKRTTLINKISMMERNEETRRLQIAVTNIEQAELWIFHACMYSQEMTDILNTKSFA